LKNIVQGALTVLHRRPRRAAVQNMGGGGIANYVSVLEAVQGAYTLAMIACNTFGPRKAVQP
jgi:hypothetical protein